MDPAEKERLRVHGVCFDFATGECKRNPCKFSHDLSVLDGQTEAESSGPDYEHKYDGASDGAEAVIKPPPVRRVVTGWPLGVSDQDRDLLAEKDKGKPAVGVGQVAGFPYYYHVLQALRRFERKYDVKVHWVNDLFGEHSTGAEYLACHDRDAYFEAVRALEAGDVRGVIWISPAAGTQSVDFRDFSVSTGPVGYTLYFRDRTALQCDFPPRDVWGSVAVATRVVWLYCNQVEERESSVRCPFGSLATELAIPGRVVKAPLVSCATLSLEVSELFGVSVGDWHFAIDKDAQMKFVVPSAAVESAAAHFIRQPKRDIANFKQAAAVAGGTMRQLIGSATQSVRQHTAFAAAAIAYADFRETYSILQHVLDLSGVASFNSALDGKLHFRLSWGRVLAFFFATLLCMVLVNTVLWTREGVSDERTWVEAYASWVLVFVVGCVSFGLLRGNSGWQKPPTISSARPVLPGEVDPQDVQLNDRIAGFNVDRPVLCDSNDVFEVSVKGNGTLNHDQKERVVPACTATGLRFSTIRPYAPGHDEATLTAALSRLIEPPDVEPPVRGPWEEDDHREEGDRWFADFCEDYRRALKDVTLPNFPPSEAEVYEYLATLQPRVGTHRFEYVRDVVTGKVAMPGQAVPTPIWELSAESELWGHSAYFVKSEVLFKARPRGIENVTPYSLVALGIYERVITKALKAYFCLPGDNKSASKFIFGGGRSAAFLAQLGEDVYDENLIKVKFDFSSWDRRVTDWVEAKAYKCLLHGLFGGHNPDHPLAKLLATEIHHNIRVQFRRKRFIKVTCKGKVKTGSAWTTLGNTVVHHLAMQYCLFRLGLRGRLRWQLAGSDDGTMCFANGDTRTIEEIPETMLKLFGMKISPFTICTGGEVDFFSCRWWPARLGNEDCYAFAPKCWRQWFKFGYQVDVPEGFEEERFRSKFLSAQAVAHCCPFCKRVFQQPKWAAFRVGPARGSLLDDDQYKPHGVEGEGVPAWEVTPEAELEWQRVYGVTIYQAVAAVGPEPRGMSHADIRPLVRIDMDDDWPAPPSMRRNPNVVQVKELPEDQAHEPRAHTIAALRRILVEPVRSAAERLYNRFRPARHVRPQEDDVARGGALQRVIVMMMCLLLVADAQMSPTSLWPPTLVLGSPNWTESAAGSRCGNSAPWSGNLACRYPVGGVLDYTLGAWPFDVGQQFGSSVFPIADENNVESGGGCASCDSLEDRSRHRAGCVVCTDTTRIPASVWLFQAARVVHSPALLALAGNNTNMPNTKTPNKKIKKEAKRLVKQIERKTRGPGNHKKGKSHTAMSVVHGAPKQRIQTQFLDLGTNEMMNANLWCQGLKDPFGAGIGQRIPDSGSMLPTYAFSLIARGTFNPVVPSSQTSAQEVAVQIYPDPFFGAIQVTAEATIGAWTSTSATGSLVPTNLTNLTANGALYRVVSMGLRVYNDAPVQARGGTFQVANVYCNQGYNATIIQGVTAASLGSMTQTFKGDLAALGGDGLRFSWFPATDRQSVIFIGASAVPTITGMAWRGPLYMTSPTNASLSDSSLIFRAVNMNSATTALSLQFEIIWNVEMIPLVGSEQTFPGKVVMGSSSMVSNEVARMEAEGPKTIGEQVAVPGVNTPMERGGVPSGTGKPNAITSAIGAVGKVAKGAMELAGWELPSLFDFLAPEVAHRHKAAVYSGRPDLSPLYHDAGFVDNHLVHNSRVVRRPFSVDSTGTMSDDEWQRWFAEALSKPAREPTPLSRPLGAFRHDDDWKSVSEPAPSVTSRVVAAPRVR